MFVLILVFVPQVPANDTEVMVRVDHTYDVTATRLFPVAALKLEQL